MIAAVALAAAVAVAVVATDASAAPLEITAEPVSLHPDDDTVDRIGSLKYLGGLALRSPHPRFGGLSGLVVSSDGRLLTLVTDRGDWIRARARHDPAGRLVGIGQAEIGRLLRPDGRPVGAKAEADAESLSPLGDGMAVAFERRHRIWLYRGAGNPFLAPPLTIAAPAALRDAGRNRGMETFATLPDRRLVVIAEDFPREAPATRGWLREGGRWRQFDYLRTGLFRPTGAAALPDGDLLVLERRFTYLTGGASRLVRIPGAALRGGAAVRGRELGRIEPPLLVDNFEGVDVRRDGSGRTLVYLVSDDNFHPVQRSLLLLFALEPD